MLTFLAAWKILLTFFSSFSNFVEVFGLFGYFLDLFGLISPVTCTKIPMCCNNSMALMCWVGSKAFCPLENIKIYAVARVQLVTPGFHPNLITNMFSRPKCLHSYTLLTWFHHNKYPFNGNTFNTSLCTTCDATPSNEALATAD